MKQQCTNCKRYEKDKIRKNTKIQEPIFVFYSIGGHKLCNYCFGILVMGVKA